MSWTPLLTRWTDGGNTMSDSSIGIIGGSDGPTAVFVTGSPFAAIVTAVVVVAVVVTAIIVIKKKKRK